VANHQEISDGLDARSAQAALKDIHDPSHLSDALKRDPNNAFLKVMAEAARLGQETARLTQQLSTEIEPAVVNTTIDPRSTTRRQLADYVRGLSEAESNARAAIPRYASLLRNERESLERYARSIHFSDNMLRSLLAGVDRRHARTAAFTERMLAAHSAFYHAYAEALAILLDQFGAYTSDSNGQIRFSDQTIAQRYNVATKALKESTNRLAQLETERKELAEGQQQGWERFVSQGSSRESREAGIDDPQRQRPAGGAGGNALKGPSQAGGMRA